MLIRNIRVGALPQNKCTRDILIQARFQVSWWWAWRWPSSQMLRHAVL